MIAIQCFPSFPFKMGGACYSFIVMSVFSSLSITLLSFVNHQSEYLLIFPARIWLTNYLNNEIDKYRITNQTENTVMKLLTAKQAAEILGVHHSRVRVLIREGRLPAQKLGREWIIMEPDLKKVKDRKPGRPQLNKGGE